jgi:anaerobic magnesium-protoporphyrin IX monomethyl ester cyclase
VILIAHSFFLKRDPKQFERSKPYAPLATLIAAAILRDRGHQVALFDATFEESADSFEATLDRIDPSIVLLVEDNFNYLTKMCTENRRCDALQMIAAAHRRGCRVAANGPDASDHPKLYLDAGAEVVLVGEGEFGVADVVAAFRGTGEPLERTTGLILLDDAGQVRYTTPRRQERDLDSLPFPAWDLADADAYRRVWTKARGYFSWNVAASRGCPYSCNWCAKPTFGRRYSQRSPAYVAEEMRLLKATVAPDHIWFVDDIFGMTEHWIAEFAREVVRRGAVIPFMMQSRTSLIHARVAEALQAAGAEEVWLGIESGSQRILDAMDKGTLVEAARTSTRMLKNQAIRVGWFLQLGYPSEEWEDIILTRDLVHDEAPDDIGVSVSYPLPGTVFYERVAADLGARRNWRDTDDLAMLFQGTYDTAFYRMVRDALHADAAARSVDQAGWNDLARRAATHRSPKPVKAELPV